MKRTALLVIDMQNGFLSPASPLFIPGAPATVPACGRLIAACRERGVPVIYVTRAYRADGSDVEKPRLAAWREGGRPLSPGCSPEISQAMPADWGEGDYHVVKPRYSAFFATGLDLLLRRLGVQAVLLAGTTTPNCIRATCFDALSLDYDVTVLSDCTSSAAEEIQQSNLRDMAALGAEVCTSEAWIRAHKREGT